MKAAEWKRSVGSNPTLAATGLYHSGMAVTTFSIAPRVPVRAFLISAVASIAGAGLLVLALINSWHYTVVVLAALILLAGLLLLVLALVAQDASAAELVLDDEGYTVSSRAGEQSGTWADVTRITRIADSGHVTIHEGEEKRAQLQFHNLERARIDEILTEMGVRLDAAKGYRMWDGS